MSFGVSQRRLTITFGYVRISADRKRYLRSKQNSFNFLKKSEINTPNYESMHDSDDNDAEDFSR